MDLEYYPGPDHKQEFATLYLNLSRGFGKKLLADAIAKNIAECHKFILDSFAPLYTALNKPYDHEGAKENALYARQNRNVGPRARNTFNHKGMRTY